MSRPLVLKVGTSTLTAGGGGVEPARISALAAAIADLKGRGFDPVLVSSGAVAAGRQALGWPELPRQIPAKQMLAAVGQPLLIGRYQQALAEHGLTAAQILLSRADLERRLSWLNARNTLRALLDQGLIPVVNENDSVATEELRFGDNDRLSALVATLVDADKLLLLTDQDGLYSADPNRDPDAVLITEVVGTVPESLRSSAGESVSGVGTGGMASKLQAADLARRASIGVIIANGAQLSRLPELLLGKGRGTYLHALGDRLEARKRFILGALEGGSVTVDGGAAQALRQGRSLLPVGVRALSGSFVRGDVIRVVDGSQVELARGVANYSADDLKRIAGLRSEEIEQRLGYHLGDVLIHRNDLVVV